MSAFHLQRFSVNQDRCAMKVCTDSLLFGAMAPVQAGTAVLDVGCGNGLLSLMAAQLGAATITAVELNPDAFLDAVGNFSGSPWFEKLNAVQADVRQFASEHTEKFDLIISNPPFFQNQLKSRDHAKRTAWHDNSLSSSELTGIAAQLLKPDGRFYVLVAATMLEHWLLCARQTGFYLNRNTGLRGFAHTEPSVYALTFNLKAASPVHETLTVYDSPGIYSDTARRYLSPFLLRFAGEYQTQQ